MKSEIRNNQIVIINETFKESFETFNELLEEYGVPTISEKVAIQDFGIIGGETNAELSEWASDYVSELHTEKCAAKHEWRYSF
jgi:uncharacterized protein (UPF0210 family)